MAKPEREAEKPSLGSVLGKFFAIIALGGILLSLGLIGIIKWIRQQPSPLPFEVAIICLLLGIALDGWAIRYFWQRRNEIFEQLK